MITWATGSVTINNMLTFSRSISDDNSFSNEVICYVRSQHTINIFTPLPFLAMKWPHASWHQWTQQVVVEHYSTDAPERWRYSDTHSTTTTNDITIYGSDDITLSLWSSSCLVILSWAVIIIPSCNNLVTNYNHIGDNWLSKNIYLQQLS